MWGNFMDDYTINTPLTKYYTPKSKYKSWNEQRKEQLKRRRVMTFSEYIERMILATLILTASFISVCYLADIIGII